jgi:hypothetical protein
VDDLHGYFPVAPAGGPKGTEIWNSRSQPYSGRAAHLDTRGPRVGLTNGLTAPLGGDDLFADATRRLPVSSLPMSGKAGHAWD